MEQKPILLILIFLISFSIYNAVFSMEANEIEEECQIQNTFPIENLPLELQLYILNQNIISIVNHSSDIFESIDQTSKYLKNINLVNTNFRSLIKDLIKTFKDSVTKKFAGDWAHLNHNELNTILEQALLEENIAKAAKAIIAKADPNIKFKAKMEQDYFYEVDPLYFSTDKESFHQLIPLLLIYGAKVNESKRIKVDTGDYQTTLNLTVFNNNQSIIEQFLNYGVNINLPDSDDDTPLITAIATNNIPMTDFLITKGANINYQNKHGNTPLIFAVDSKDILLTQILLNHEADPNIKNTAGLNALDFGPRIHYNCT